MSPRLCYVGMLATYCSARLSWCRRRSLGQPCMSAKKEINHEGGRQATDTHCPMCYAIDCTSCAGISSTSICLFCASATLAQELDEHLYFPPRCNPPVLVLDQQRGGLCTKKRTLCGRDVRDTDHDGRRQARKLGLAAGGSENSTRLSKTLAGRTKERQTRKRGRHERVKRGLHCLDICKLYSDLYSRGRKSHHEKHDGSRVRAQFCAVSLHIERHGIRKERKEP
jgi:hypothetical protein